MVGGFAAFFLTRHWRYMRDKKRDEERAMNTALFGVISAPNGLGGNSTTPPPYYEALKTGQTSFPPTPATAQQQSAGHRGEKSTSMIMDECWKAVYATEDSLGSAGTRNSSVRGDSTTAAILSSYARQHNSKLDIEQPVSPRVAAHGEMRQSVSRWFRNQKWMPSKPASNGAGPLSSNPSGQAIKDLPVPPSPSYTGVPPTSSSLPPTPTTATYLAPGENSPYHEPLSARSARSWLTGDDRLSIRASIPNSVLYPSPLQPAPPPKNRSLTNGSQRGSVNSQSDYGSSTWQTITPADEPPRYNWESSRRRDDMC